MQIEYNVFLTAALNYLILSYPFFVFVFVWKLKY